MFYRLWALETLDIETINTTKTENMQWMFNWCKNLESIDLSNFDTSNVTNMISMFHECVSLKTLDLTSFDTRNVEKMRAMFNICPSLETIYVSEYFNTDSLVDWDDGSNNMFALDTNLVWWNGTKFSDLGVDDKTYALIDNESQSWYFTDAGNIMVRFINIDDETIQYSYTGLSRWDTITGLTSDEIERETGHSLQYYADSWLTVEFDFSQPITKYTEVYTHWTLNQYTITFVKWNGEGDFVITQDYGSDVDAPADPVRNGYTFKGWDKEIPATMPAENIVITAQWEAQKSWGWYSGWWGHSHDNSDHESTWDVEKENNTQEQEATPTDNQSSDIETQKQDSTKSVHEWSYKNWLTQYANEKNARLWDYLTRSQMAKISSIFATKVLWKLPDESKYNFCSQFADISTLNTEMKSYVIESCELWYMWYQSNGTDSLVKFRPYSPITVAEVAVIVSRMLRWNQNAGDWNKWYQWHLYAAYNHELIDDIRNPFRNITRWEAFEIFYRTSQSK
jgi:surface protein